jgi:hypothetical protein
MKAKEYCEYRGCKKKATMNFYDLAWYCREHYYKVLRDLNGGLRGKR